MSSDKDTQIEAPLKPPHPYPPRGEGKKLIKLTEDPEYMKQYALKDYHAKRSAPIPCDNCGKLVCCSKIRRHVKTLLCARRSKDPLEIERIKEEHRQSLLTPKIEEGA